MKLKKFAARLLAGGSITGLVLLLVSCGASNTVDYVYVISNQNSPGQISVYDMDSESGQLYQIHDSPYPSGGVNPVAEVVSPNGKNLYVANHDDNTIVMFAIGSDAKLYPLQTTTTPGTEPVAMAMNASGTALFVLDYYAPAAPGLPSYTDLNPGPGAVIVYSVNPANGELIQTPLANGSANYWQVQCFPSNLALTPNGNDLYVTNTNAVVVTTAPPVTGTIPQVPAACQTAGVPDPGSVSAFTVNSGGSQSVSGLTQVGLPLSTGAGSAPTGIAADPDNATIYVTDSALNVVDSYAVQSDGSLSLITSAPTGTMPMGAVVFSQSGSAGNYLYVSNFNDGSISSYSLQSGVPTPLATTNSGTSGPLCMTIDPDLNRYLFVSDYIGAGVGGAFLDPATGSLTPDLGSPYLSTAQPTCVTAISHPGNNQGLK